MTSPAIEISQLSKVYPGPPKRVTAVKGIDLRVSNGEIFGLLGPNGAGKTTTVGVCTTKVRPTSGRVEVAGFDVTSEPSQVKRAIGVMPQTNTLDRNCTVWENIYLHCRFFSMSPRAAKRKTSEMLEMFQLTDRAKALPWSLSGGLAQRLQLARVMAHDPAILFLDEPTAGLDPQSRLALWDIVRQLRQTGVTVLLTTHYMEEADELCDRIAIIDHGEILVLDRPEALKRSVTADSVMIVSVERDQESLGERLRQMPEISDVSEMDGQLRLKIRGGEETVAQVAEAALRHGLRSISSSEPTLESVFIDLTGRGLRE